MSACTGDGRGNASDPDQSVALPTSQIQLASALTPFESCEPFLRHIKDNALNMVSAWGVAGSYFPAVMEGEMLRDAVPETMALDSKSSSQTQYSTTNIQEAGVDEPDIVKTDGQRIVALVENRLHVLKANSGELRQSGELRLARGGRCHVVVRGGRPAAAVAVVPLRPGDRPRGQQVARGAVIVAAADRLPQGRQPRP